MYRGLGNRDEVMKHSTSIRRVKIGCIQVSMQKESGAYMIESLLMKKDPKVSASAATEEWSGRCNSGQR